MIYEHLKTERAMKIHMVSPTEFRQKYERKMLLKHKRFDFTSPYEHMKATSEAIMLK